MNTEFLQGSSGISLEIRKAILLYSSTGGDFLATVHDIENGGLLPGTPIDSNCLSDVVAQLTGQSQAGRTILPARVLYSDGSLLYWWCPSARRPIYFKSGKPELDEASGKEVLHPPLVFMARAQRLSVWALDTDVRPSAGSQLFVAPYFNLYDGGGMCTGNVRLPESLSASEETLAAWEEAFFGTNFTHSNLGGGALTKFRGGHNALWKAMANASTFPTESLAVAKRKLTLEEALATGGKS